MGTFKENYHFPRFQRGSNIFRGRGVHLYRGGGGWGGWGGGSGGPFANSL